jgi:hypothetical protein
MIVQRWIAFEVADVLLGYRPVFVECIHEPGAVHPDLQSF